MKLKNFFRDKKILILGGSGFIGTNLVKELVRFKSRATVVCRTKPPAALNGVSLITGDIEDRGFVESLIKKRFQVIFHLAGMSGQIKCLQNPVESIRVNMIGGINILEAVRKFSPQSVMVFSNSRLEYGQFQYLPVDEQHPAIPISVYGVEKLCLSLLAQIYYQTYAVKTVVLRSSNPFGPHPVDGGSDYSLINHFIDRAIRNETIKIYGRGRQSRDYFYIDDLVRAFLMVAVSKTAVGKIYNVGGGKKISLKDMAKKIVKLAGGGKLVYCPWPKLAKQAETGDYCSDIKRIRQDVGWEPKIDIEEAIKKTIELHKRRW